MKEFKDDEEFIRYCNKINNQVIKENSTADNMLIEKDAKVYLDQRKKYIQNYGYKFAEYLKERRKMNEKKINLRCDVFSENLIEITKYDGSAGSEGLFLEVSDGNKAMITFSLDKEKKEELIAFLTGNNQ